MNYREALVKQAMMKEYSDKLRFKKKKSKSPKSP